MLLLKINEKTNNLRTIRESLKNYVSKYIIFIQHGRLLLIKKLIKLTIHYYIKTILLY